MSKQENRVNIEPEILHENWSFYWKYNGSLLTLLLLVKLTSSFHIIMQAIPIQCRRWLKK